MLVTPTPPFAELFREHAPHAGRALRNLGVGDADLPDALQETFLVVHKKLADFRGESSLRTWIYGICVRVAAAAGLDPMGDGYSWFPSRAEAPTAQWVAGIRRAADAVDGQDWPPRGGARGPSRGVNRPQLEMRGFSRRAGIGRT